MSRRVYRFLAATLLLAYAAPLHAAEIRLPRHPDYSEGRIVFSYLGDPWLVNDDGTNHRRLTVHPAHGLRAETVSSPVYCRPHPRWRRPMATRTWLRPVSARPRRPRKPRPAFRPRVEALEDRATPTGGLLDPTFSTGGVALVPTDTYVTQPVTAVQPDRKILSLGTAAPRNAFYQPAVTRLNANGTVDTTFGTNGTVDLPVAKNAYGTALAVAPDGKILVGVKAYLKNSFSGDSDAEFAVARLNPNGNLDTTFGNNHGYWLDNPTAQDEVVDRLATVPAAGGGYGVIVGGTAGQANGSTAFAAAKLTSAGMPDSTFRTGGLAVRIVSTGVSVGTTSMAVMASGEIVFAGLVGTSGSALYGRVLVGFTPACQSDSGFGSGGVVTLYGNGTGGTVISTVPGTIRGMSQAVVAAQGNNLIVAGTVVVNDPVGTGVTSGGYVIRYTSAGALDSTSRTGGVFCGPANSITGNSQFLQVSVAADGLIALAGLSTRKDANNVSPSGLVVGRLTADGAADPGFGTDGTGLVIRYDQDPYPSYGYLSLCVDPSGNILVGRVATENPAHGYLMRFTVT